LVEFVDEIQWNDAAFEMLVLEENHKRIIKSLVEFHKFEDESLKEKTDEIKNKTGFYGL